MLQIIERTISLAWQEIPNLELITFPDLVQIQTHLQETYNTNELLPINSLHLFKLLEASKLVVVGTNKVITCILKIPIIKPISLNYSQIYPLPNSQEIVLIPPRKYLLETEQHTYWTDEHCKIIDTHTLCINNPLLFETCKLNSPTQCPTAVITNNYEITLPLQNHQLLTAFRNQQDVLEDCNGQIQKKFIQGTNLISSSCHLLIGENIYDNTNPTFNVKIPNISQLALQPFQETSLQVKHFLNPQDLQMEARQLQTIPIHLLPAVHIAHYSFTSLMCLILISITVIVLKFRQRLHDLLCKPAKITIIKRRQQDPQEHELRHLTPTQHTTIYPSLSVDEQT